MNFLKSAVASAIAQGPPFPYTFGDRVDVDQSIWTLYNGTKREDGSNCSIFSFDITNNKSRLPLAKNALKKLRTMRHPGTETYIYIATERLVPLRWHVKRKSLSPETMKWGLYSVARTIKFINDDASSIHGNLKVASIYTSESGEWKVGGFEVLSNVKDDEATYGSLVPDSSRYTPPELARSGWDSIKKSPHSAVDAFNYGTLLFEVFNGDFMGADQAGQTKNIPPTMQSSYKRLVNANPKARLSVGHFLEQGLRHGAFFDTPLIKLTDGVDNLGMKSAEERDEFLDDLDQLTDDFPEDFFKMKVLPELLKSVEFGGGGPKALNVVMKISAKLSNDDFDTKVTPVIIRLFGNPDRAIRVCLLDSLPLMIDRLSQRVVNDKIFPHLVTGFTDLAPVVREQTLKSVLVIISKLSDRTVNGELLKYLAKTANDEQPGIRTNTTICLGKIAKNLEVAEDDADAWGDMDDGGDDGFFDASNDSQPQSLSSSTTVPKKSTSGSRTTSGGSAAPFDDGAEPDFAGWLAAQAQKKSGPGKQLPKGLAKPTGSLAAKKPATVTKPAAKPIAAKKIDLKPKETADDDGWGDGW
ncbi:putative scy1 protein kinase protein [Phaeoacremonium minimum UCRPA7]|uniref:Putative scy1 protein kinase protein n=1 Tax=Phaeoacremonium minimum (strain UCR-PA7) TaxID=1286976 RepID=R8BT68_PHAM7|nr:putative scy1 protein kinase protein [Phaeoacremonium minimum UCRPA7]EOO02598.1 putative scy1 protein kinase protein [Phaeoacremonium minimum UCRPA7]